MVTALAFALLATIYASTPIASWTVRQYTFEDPDTVANMHAAVFMGVNLLALVTGWLVGWLLARRLGEE
jgi:vancomycin permeability regulator SanA